MESRKLLLFISSILLFWSMTHADNVETICKNTPNSELCVKVLHKAPVNAYKSSKDFAIVLAEEMHSTVKAAVDGGSTMMCGNRVYATVLDSTIPSLEDALGKMDVKLAEERAAAISEAANLCEHTYNKGYYTQLTAINKNIADLADITKALISA